jgi:hypothetical protein
MWPKPKLLIVRREVFTGHDSQIIDKPNPQRDAIRDVEDFGYSRRTTSPHSIQDNPKAHGLERLSFAVSKSIANIAIHETSKRKYDYSAFDKRIH